MRRTGQFFGLLILMYVLFALPVSADEKTLNMETRILEDFDNPEESKWIVRGSKFSAEGFPKIAFPVAIPDALFIDDEQKSEEDYKVMGVRGSFDRKGYNYIEFIPDRTDEEGNYIGITIPGNSDFIDLWVWGSNYDYYLEAHLLDFKGFPHVLPLGSLKYNGWKNLKVEISPNIPQAATYAPHLKELRLVKLVLWTRPDENVADFFIYFDQIKVLTDVFVTRFDGDQFTDPESIKEIWSTGTGGETQQQVEVTP